MALTQSERIDVSKKQISIPLDKQNVVNTKSKIQEQIAIAQASDDTSKGLMDAITVYINPYQSELERYDGTGRTQLVEQDLIDSANRVNHGPFFPSDTNISLPSVPDGVWKNFVPFSNNSAVGRTYTEGFNSVSNENAQISAILATITSIEAFSAPTRSSGDVCGPNPNPPPADLIEPDLTIQGLVTTLTSQVNGLRAFTLSTKASVPTIFKTPTMQTENTAAKTAIDTLVAAMDAWLVYPDFTSIGAASCSVFDTYNVASLPPSKLRATELDVLKAAMNTKSTFNTTRVSQISGYLGSIAVDGKGNVTTANGWYGDRFRIIDIRLNVVTGTLSSLVSLQNSTDAQTSTTASLDNQLIVYDTLLKTSLMRAPASGNKIIHVIDATGFAVSDSVYVFSDGKPEISATILAISNNTITLDTDIPKSYIPDNYGRIYKAI